MRKNLRRPRWMRGSFALALGLVSLGVPAAPPLAGELGGQATARIEQLAGLVVAEVAAEDTGLQAAGLGAAAAPGPLATELTVTAAPHTAVTLTFAAAPQEAVQAATDAEGRFVLRLDGIAEPRPSGGITRVIVNY